MLFERRLRDGLANGSITVAFRRWKRPQVVAGRHYRSGGDGPLVEAVHVDVIDPGAIRSADARAAGFASRQELLDELRGDAEAALYRVVFRVVDGPDPRTALAAAAGLAPGDVEALDARLARLDRATIDGPWTDRTLRLIADHPAVVSTTLAEQLGLDRLQFKRRVRALKEIGLTISLETGYQLSPRGDAYVAHRSRE